MGACTKSYAKAYLKLAYSSLVLIAIEQLLQLIVIFCESLLLL